MSRSDLARLSVVVAILVLPACSGGGASTPAGPTTSSALRGAAQLTPASLRPSNVPPAEKMSSLARLTPASLRGSGATSVLDPSLLKTSSVRQRTSPSSVRQRTPSSLRSSVVSGSTPDADSVRGLIAPAVTASPQP